MARKTTRQKKNEAWERLEGLAAEYGCIVRTWISEGRYPGAELYIERGDDRFAWFTRNSRKISLDLLNQAIQWFEQPSKLLPQPKQPQDDGQNFWQTNGPFVLGDARYKGAVPIGLTRDPKFWEQVS